MKKPPERRLTNEIRLPNGRFGSKVSREGSEEKQEDAYQLQWSQELVQNLLPPAKAAKYDSGYVLAITVFLLWFRISM